MKLSRRRRAGVACGLALCVFALRAAKSSAAQDQPQKPTTDSLQASSVDRHMTRGEYLARQALTYRGVPYRFGGTNVRGIDCSGLTQAIYKHYGLLLPRTAVTQFHQGTPVKFENLQAGDLVFFKNTYRRGISHVGIYVGGGEFIHAANRHKGVTVSRLSEPYYSHHLAGARRLPLASLPALDQADQPQDIADDEPADDTLRNP